MGIGEILTGWTKWLGWQKVSQEEKELSAKRQRKCVECEHSKVSKFLEFIGEEGEYIDSLYCSQCNCPCHQKSLSNEICPIGKWNNL